MRAPLYISLFSLLGFCGDKPIPTIGHVKLTELCDDTSRCEVRGDGVYNALKKGAPPYLARGAGPEQYLGKVAPKRNPASVLTTCGGEVAASDYLSSAPTPREVTPDKEGKRRIRDAIKGQLVRAMSKAGIVERADSKLKARVDAAVAAVDFQKLSMVEQTYWLSDAAFEKRVGQCGEEFYDQVVYSITVIGLSDLFQKDLELKLSDSLAAKLAVTPVVAPPSLAVDTTATTEAAATLEGQAAAPTPPASPEPPPGAIVPAADAPPLISAKDCAEVARQAITELAKESRFVAAFGFDDK
jgi:hypothetical protein